MELRECPFCGASVDWCECGSCHQIQCKGCGAQIDNTKLGLIAETLEKCRLEFAAWWNRRAIPASVPGGYALVPAEPTEEMKLAWVSHKSFDGCYKAMLAAAPTPSTWPDGTPRAFDNYAHDKQFSEDSPTPPVSEDRWQPIETAPKDGTRIIVVSETGNVWCGVYWEKRPRAGERWTSFVGPLRFNPTHWMPLPKAPAKEGK